MLAVTQCAVRPSCAARSRGARAQLSPQLPAAASRLPEGLAAAPRRARCSRHRAGAVVSTPRRTALRRLATTCGLPIIGPVLSSPLTLIAWAIGAAKLFTGFSKTTYTDALIPKLALCAIWCAGPAL